VGRRGWTIVDALRREPQAPGNETRVADVEMNQVGRGQRPGAVLDTRVRAQILRAADRKRFLVEQREAGAIG